MKFCKMALFSMIGLALMSVEVAAQDASKCVEFKRVRNQQVLDDSTIVVSLPSKQYRKISMNGVCRRLKNVGTFDIGKDPVCPGAAIQVRGESAYCVIADIETLEEAAAKELMAKR